MEKEGYTEYGYRGLPELQDAWKRIEELKEQNEQLKEELAELHDKLLIREQQPGS